MDFLHKSVHRIKDNYNSKKSSTVTRGILSLIAGLTVAYSSILDKPASAEPYVTGSEGVKNEVKSLDIVENSDDVIIADLKYFKQTGVYLINGLPTISIPAVNPANNQEYLLSYLSLNAPGAQINSRIEKLVDEAYGVSNRKHVFPTTTEFLKLVKGLAEKDHSREKTIQFVYSGLYALQTMPKWMWDDSKGHYRVEGVVENSSEYVAFFEKKFVELDDGSDEYNLLKEEVALMSLDAKISLLNSLSANSASSERDLNNFIESNNLLTDVRLLRSVFENRIRGMRDGNVGKQQVQVMTNLLFDLERDLVSFKNEVIKRQMLTGSIRDFIEESFKVTLDTSMKVADALGPITEENSIQEIRDYLVRSPNKVEMAAYLSDTFRVASNVSIDGSISFSSADLTNIAQSTYANARAITAKYSNQDLYLPADYNAIAPLDKAMIAFAGTMDTDNFDQVAANATVEKDLGALLARVEKNKFKWTNEDLTEFRTMYNNANGSPEAEKKFLSVVKSFITVKDARIERSKEPEQVDVALMPHYVEGENGIEETTTYLAYKYKIAYTVDNPFPVQLTGELKLKTNDMVIQMQDRARGGFFTIAPNKYTDVTFTGYQVLEPNQELTQPITTPPIPEVQLAMADLQKIALLGQPEILASVEGVGAGATKAAEDVADADDSDGILPSPTPSAPIHVASKPVMLDPQGNPIQE